MFENVTAQKRNSPRPQLRLGNKRHSTATLHSKPVERPLQSGTLVLFRILNKIFSLKIPCQLVDRCTICTLVTGVLYNGSGGYLAPKVETSEDRLIATFHPHTVRYGAQ